MGLVTADAVDGATGSLRAIATQDFPVASDTARIAELFHLASEGRPIAVVDEEDRRLLGSVSPYEILRVLGEVEVVDYAPQTTEETR